MEEIRAGAALATPMIGEGLDSRINYDAFEELIGYVIKGEVDAIIVSGCTGQSFALSHDEKERLMETAFAYVKAYRGVYVSDYVKVIPGVGQSSTRATIDLAKEMENLGAETVLIVSPCGNKPTQDGLKRHYETIAENIEADIIMYSVPSRTGGEGILPATADYLADIDNIVGIKEACGNLERIKETIERTKGKDFYVVSGDDKLSIAIIQAGGVGTISVAANVDPSRVASSVHYAIMGHFQKAREIDEALKPLYAVLFEEPNPMPLHYALTQLGIEAGIPRLPLTDVKPETKQNIEKVLRGLHLI